MSTENIKKRLYMLPKPVLYVFALGSVAVMLLNMLLILADVFCRYVLNTPLSGVTEIVAMMMAWVAYLGSAYTLMIGGHMHLGTIYDKLHGRANHILSAVIYLIATLFSCVGFRASLMVFTASFKSMEKAVATTTVYIWIGKFGPVIGWALLAIEAAFITVYSIIGAIKPETTPNLTVKSELDEIKELEAAEEAESDDN